MASNENVPVAEAVTSDNPYSPPKTAVRDAMRTRLLAERPRQIVHATALLWISLALTLVSALLQIQASNWSLWGPLALWSFALALASAMNVAVWRGRNWARVLYALLMILTVVTLPLERQPPPTAIENALDAITFVVDLVILYLMFTKPGSLWFRYAPHGSVA